MLNKHEKIFYASTFFVVGCVIFTIWHLIMVLIGVLVVATPIIAFILLTKPLREKNMEKSGNVAFDQYLEAEYKRLNEQRSRFGQFMEKLRFQKEKVDFELFMLEQTKE